MTTSSAEPIVKPVRLGTIEALGAPRTVVEIDGRLHDLGELLRRCAVEAPQPEPTVSSVLQNWSDWAPLLGLITERAAGQPALPADRLSWLSPIPCPRKLVIIGANYRDHLEELGVAGERARNPFAVLKPASTSVLGAGKPLRIPPDTRWVDWEGELGVVIGRRVSGVSAATALAAVGGYTIVNDVSARDCLERQVPGLGIDWLLHKGFDGFTPVGPLVTPSAFVADPQDLEIVTTVDGVVKQRASTAAMIFDVREIVEHLSSVMTLEPGDIIATGTPAGVGFARAPRERLAPGSSVTVSIDGLGELVTPVTGPVADTAESDEGALTPSTRRSDGSDG